MLQKIEHLAHISVARGCAFAALAVVTFMIGISGDLARALEMGGILSLVICFVLLLKAWRSGQRSYRSTEVWMMLSPQERPHSDIAQHLIATALRDTCLRFALLASRIATGLLLSAVAYSLIGAGQP